jgi:hypothetical protein
MADIKQIRTLDEVQAETIKELSILRHKPWGPEDYFDAKLVSSDGDSVSFAATGVDGKEYVAAYKAVQVGNAHLWEFTGARLRSSYQ